ncbi:hypothetical protein [Sulfurimonas sp. HSL-1716]|uniref:hypothetical protein n=1 Tax=Hydrocurvibacter sulfurireducens TaxID=3131937 RepID=UPI0031F8D8A5
MYKALFCLIATLIISGCSIKKAEEKPPPWYMNPPKDSEFIYETASATTLLGARNNALLLINRNLYSQIMKTFKASNSPLHIKNELEYKELMQASSKAVNDIVFQSIKILHTIQFHSNQFILLAVPKNMIFQKEKKKLDALYEPLKKELESIDGLSTLEQYARLKPAAQKLNKIAVLAALLQTLSAGFDTHEYFTFVNDTKERTAAIKNSMSVRVLGDFNSLKLVNQLKQGLSKEDIFIDKTLNRENGYDIFMLTDAAQKTDSRFFNIVLTVKIITATKDKKIISVKTHTFTGKSNKSYEDAKLQAESNMNARLRSLRIFDFLGLIKK